MMALEAMGSPMDTNSGVYMQNRYEIQIESPKGKNIEDPYNWKIGPHGIAAFAWTVCPTAMPGDRMANGMPSTLFSKMPSGKVTRR